MMIYVIASTATPFRVFECAASWMLLNEREIIGSGRTLTSHSICMVQPLS